MNQYRTLNKVFAALSFVVALVTYLLTLQPSVPFWDCGEFSAAAMQQQVPHPPGAPLWLMAAKTFEVFLPGDPGHNFNVFAAVCSALSAMFVYLIAVNAVERFNPYRPGRSAASYITTYGAGLIGALAFVWSDSNWFNSVESEVYSAATFLASVVMWLMMKWDQQAEQKGHERWMLLIAYVLGLSIGVHLLALLVIPSIALTIYFRRYKKFELIPLLITIVVMGVAFGVLYNSTLSWIPSLLSSSTGAGIALLAALVGLAIWSFVEKRSIIFLSAMSFSLVILGYTTYTQILVRSSAHPVMNENMPDNFNELRRYLGREQYGDRPNWPRRVEYDSWHAEPMASYGAPTPPTGQNPDGSLIFENVDFGAEMNYMFSYQIYHMYLRYLFWNFAGRVSDVQDAGVSAFGAVTAEAERDLIRPTGAEDVFPVSFYMIPLLLGLFGIVVHFRRDWKMATVFMTAFLFLGVLAALQQRQQEPQPRERDYFYAGSFMIFAIWVGFGALGVAEIAGAKKKAGGMEREEDDVNGGVNVGVAGAVMAAGLLLAPINMAIGGWALHDRSSNWLAWDYGYNILQSCDKNAILFTNGDNDTFPLWYLQDVAGVRRDVRVVNLELAQTPWYILQMKTEASWDAPPVPMTFPVNMLLDDGSGRNKIGPAQGAATMVTVPVPGRVMSWATNGKNSADGTMQWQFTPTGSYRGEGYFSPKNQIVRSIVEQTAKEGWERPVFFSQTVGNEFAGLEPYLRMEGMAYRVMPVEQTGFQTNDEVLRKCLLETLPDDEWHTEQHYGFKFRGLNNPHGHFLGQEDHRRAINFFYHRIYVQFAQQLLYGADDKKGAIAVLDKMVELIPPDRFGPPPQLQLGETYAFLAKIAMLYRDAGATEQAKAMAQKVLDRVDELTAEGFLPRVFSPEDQPDFARGVALAILGDYTAAMDALDKSGQQMSNPSSVLFEKEMIRIEQMIAKGDSAGARTALQKLVTDAGLPASDQRVRSMIIRFPSLSNVFDTAAPAPSAPAPAAGTDSGVRDTSAR